MKKTIALLLALVMVFALVACGGKDVAETPETPDTPNTPVETPETPETESRDADGNGRIDMVYAPYLQKPLPNLHPL